MNRSIIKELSGPLHFSIDITSNCNAKCLHCFNSSGKNWEKEKDLSDYELIELVKQVADFKPFSVCYCGGEPMLRYDLIVECSQILKTSGVNNISFVTNGWYITQEKAIALISSGVNHIQLSLDGAQKETHDKIRGIIGIYDKVLESIEIFEKLGLKYAIAFSPTKLNIEQFSDLVNMLKNYNFLEAIRVQPLMPLGETKSNKKLIYLSELEYRKLVNQIDQFQIELSKRNISLQWGDPIDHIYRFSARENKFSPYLEIKSNGDLVVSAFLPIVVGNIKRHSLKEYWEAGFGYIWDIDEIKVISKFLDSVEGMSDIEEKIVNEYDMPKIVLDIIDDEVIRRQLCK